MREILYKGQTYAIHDTLGTIERKKNVVYDLIEFPTLKADGTTWYGNDREAIQASRMVYHKRKEFKAHRHILRPRLSNYTQECFVIHQGKIRIDIYGNDKKDLGSIEAKAGDIVLLYRGYHKLTVLENNSIFFEIKNGEFTTVEADKEYF